MERGKARTVVGAAHHEDRGHLTWQRAPLTSQLTREENNVRGRGIAHERGNRAREGEESRAGGRKRARGSGGARGKIADALHLPPCLCASGVLGCLF